MKNTEEVSALTAELQNRDRLMMEMRASLQSKDEYSQKLAIESARREEMLRSETQAQLNEASKHANKETGKLLRAQQEEFVRRETEMKQQVQDELESMKISYQRAENERLILERRLANPIVHTTLSTQSTPPPGVSTILQDPRSTTVVKFANGSSAED